MAFGVTKAIRAGRAFVEIGAKDTSGPVFDRIKAKMLSVSKAAIYGGIALAAIGGGALAVATKLLGEFMEKSNSPDAKALSYAVAKASEAFGKLKMSIAAALAPLATKFLGALEPMLLKGADLVSNWPEYWNGAVGAIEQRWLEFKTTYIGSTEGIADAARGMWDGIKSASQMASEFIGSTWTATANTLAEAFGFATDEFGAETVTMADYWTEFRTSFAAGSSAIAQGFIATSYLIRDTWDSVTTSMQSMFANSADGWAGLYKEILKAIPGIDAATSPEIANVDAWRKSILENADKNKNGLKARSDARFAETKAAFNNVEAEAKKSIQRIRNKFTRDKMLDNLLGGAVGGGLSGGVDVAAMNKAARIEAEARAGAIDMTAFTAGIADGVMGGMKAIGEIKIPAAAAGSLGNQAIGTFSGAAAMRLGSAGGMADRMVKEAAKTNKQLATTNSKLDTINASIEDGSVF